MRGGGAMSRTTFCLGIALYVLTVAFLLTDRLIADRTPGVTERNVRRIRPGMTMADVEAILGGTCEFGVGFQDRWQRQWYGEEGGAYVQFEANQVVEPASFEAGARSPWPWLRSGRKTIITRPAPQP
jgi:hypothetical protein